MAAFLMCVRNFRPNSLSKLLFLGIPPYVRGRALTPHLFCIKAEGVVEYVVFPLYPHTCGDAAANAKHSLNLDLAAPIFDFTNTLI